MTVEEEGSESTGKKRCPYCSVGFLDKIEHKESQRHLLNYRLFQLSKNRQQLSANRHNIEVLITSDETFNRTRKKKTYTCEVPADKSTVSVGLQVKNNREEDVLIVEACRLIDYKSYVLTDANNLSDQPPGTGLAVRLLKKTTYNFRLDFTNPGVGCYRVPIHFSFLINSKTKEKKEFSIIREIEVRVQGDIKYEKEDNEKSPYVGETWNKIEMTIEGTQTNGKPICKILQYSVPKELRELVIKNLEVSPAMTSLEKNNLEKLVSKFETPSKRRIESEGSTLGFTAVREDNYKEFFHDLLYIEEEEQKHKMAKYNMTGVTVRISKNGAECELDVPGLAEKRPSILRKDIVYLRLQKEPTVQYSGLVKDVRERSIVIGGVDYDFMRRLAVAEKSGRPFLLDVRFSFSRYPIYVQHRALDLATQDTLANLFPKAEECGKWPELVMPKMLRGIKFVNPQVEKNTKQKEAVFNVLKGTSLPAPYIIFGPPGTGKTVTLVEAVLQIKENFAESHILVSAQCNSACDYIAGKLYASGQCKRSEIVRLNSTSRTEEIPAEIRAISTTCPQPKIKEMAQYRIIVCTLITAGRFIECKDEDIRRGSVKQSHSFSHVFIDEAGQASECESLVAISGLLKKPFPNMAQGQLILAGDPQQLGPVCNGNKSKNYGLGVSLLERLMANIPIYGPKDDGTYNGTFITQLVENYRSHEDILSISNQLFYNKNLIPKGVKDELCHSSFGTDAGQPVTFHGVLGEEKKEGKSPSIFNVMEISVVVNYVKKLLSLKVRDRVRPEDIGVIAPYARQVYKLKQEFFKREGWSKIEVGTTETFQGREKRVIIVSTVRSQTNMIDYDKKFRLGFLREPKRFNVIMTRAQSKLIVVGNPVILGQDRCWRFLIDLAVEKNSYLGCPLKFRDDTWENDLVSKIERLQSDVGAEKNR